MHLLFFLRIMLLASSLRTVCLALNLKDFLLFLYFLFLVCFMFTRKSVVHWGQDGVPAGRDVWAEQVTNVAASKAVCESSLEQMT